MVSEQYRIALADPAFLNGSSGENGLVGKTLEVRLCFVNPATGTPFDNLADTFVVYKGKIDSHTIMHIYFKGNNNV